MSPVLIGVVGEVIAGHGRPAAAQLLGLAEVPVLPVTHLSPAETRAQIIADNRLADKTGWDKEILAIELQTLVDMDFDVEVVGFELAEIDLTLDEVCYSPIFGQVLGQSICRREACTASDLDLISERWCHGGGSHRGT